MPTFIFLCQRKHDCTILEEKTEDMSARVGPQSEEQEAMKTQKMLKSDLNFKCCFSSFLELFS